MLSVANDMFPLKKHSVEGIPTPPQWDQKYTRAVEKRRGTEILYYRNMSQQNFINLFKIRVKSRRLPLRKKLIGWRSFWNPYDPGAYSPIVLSSVLAKIAEHLVKNRLEWITESRGPLVNSQYEFRKGRSTVDNLSIFTSDIRVSFFQGKSVTASFLDVSSAYDNVQLPILRNKDDPSADLHFLSIIENGWLGWHTIFTDASKFSEAECDEIGTFHSQYNIVQKVRRPPKSSVLTVCIRSQPFKYRRKRTRGSGSEGHNLMRE
ncbi:Probable RNA-directed DNA polymerase from transposon X-element [Eumeta japonica]|uniref:Probable RNA-directed DNA polymerase from transposon X-element n=1 Tax=Eumeta variegata TaxID=151549 RepID=A0A4C1V5S2_EUMVA|nr:Probable RNA-directed DNA polymerase from transposon X-element [Eumeta japonica]